MDKSIILCGEKAWEVEVIRPFTMMVVVFFHACCMMCAPVHFPDSYELYALKYDWLTSVCLWFHMPLFIFLSGGVYGFLSNTGKYGDKVKFIKNKLQRLLLPYVCFATLFMLTTNSWSWETLFKGPGFTHLWFLLMLFWCFVVICLLREIKKVVQWSKIGDVFILFISYMGISFPNLLPRFLGVNSFIGWFFWFYLGYVVYLHRNVVLMVIRKSVFIPLLLPLIYTMCMWIAIKNVCSDGSIMEKNILQIGYFAAVIWLWYVTCRAIDVFGNEWTRCRFISELSKCSFGIYIFHYWLQGFMVSRTAQRIFPLADWAANYTVLFPIAFFLLSLLISYVMTKVVLLTKMGRGLLA